MQLLRRQGGGGAALAEEHFGGLVNMDLIAGLPADSREGFGRTLERVLAMEPANITPPDTPLRIWGCSGE